MNDKLNNETKFPNSAALHEAMLEIGVSARKAVRELSTVSTKSKNKALFEAATAIRGKKAIIKAANNKDMSTAEKKKNFRSNAGSAAAG
jgi:gamma-glutamyl phosphate reductase